jgi:hypothetical protein
MTEQEHYVRQCEIDVRESEAKVRRAKEALDNGYAKLKAQMEEDYSKLKHEMEAAQIKLEKDRQYLAAAKDKAARGFD